MHLPCFHFYLLKVQWRRDASPTIARTLHAIFEIRQLDVENTRKICNILPMWYKFLSTVQVRLVLSDITELVCNQDEFKRALSDFISN